MSIDVILCGDALQFESLMKGGVTIVKAIRVDLEVEDSLLSSGDKRYIFILLCKRGNDIFIIYSDKATNFSGSGFALFEAIDKRLEESLSGKYTYFGGIKWDTYSMLKDLLWLKYCNVKGREIRPLSLSDKDLISLAERGLIEEVYFIEIPVDSLELVSFKLIAVFSGTRVWFADDILSDYTAMTIKNKLVEMKAPLPIKRDRIPLGLYLLLRAILSKIYHPDANLIYEIQSKFVGLVEENPE